MADDRIAAGMAAQLDSRRRRAAAGQELIGWKAGLNAPAAQAALGLDRPVVGFLSAASELAPGDACDLAGATNPGVEPELAVRLAAQLPPEATREEAAAAIGALAPALEVVDLDRPLDDLEAILAGNVFHRAVLFGADQGRRSGGDLDGLAVSVQRNGEAAGTAAAADAYGDLSSVLLVLAERLLEAGETMGPGDRVIMGAMTPIVPVTPGDTVRADFGPLGALELSFTG